MPVLLHGVDLVECVRIQRVWERHGHAFLRRIYTPAECDYCVNCKTPVERLAGRWAAKEAVLKALGTGWRGGVEFADIEILPDAYGRPHCRLQRRTAALAAELGVRTMLVSISHAGGYAIGSAIGTD